MRRGCFHASVVTLPSGQCYLKRKQSAPLPGAASKQEGGMTVSVIDPVSHPKKTTPKGTGKMIVHDSENFHVWIHGPDHPGEKGPMHKHSADQFFVCVQGEITYNFPDRPSATLTPGMMIVIPKGDFYQIENRGTVDTILVGSRAEPGKNPRFSEKGAVVTDKNLKEAGANY
jgi:mannose-6-phosphate isomerase-like protein (cupin superfamily)